MFSRISAYFEAASVFVSSSHRMKNTYLTFLRQLVSKQNVWKVQNTNFKLTVRLGIHDKEHFEKI